MKTKQWKLTEQHKAQIRAWNERWERIIMGTEPIDFERTREAVYGMCAALVKAATGKEIAAAYMGPCLSGAVEVVHPEHQHQHFPDHDCTVIVYQRNLDAEQREIRARD